MRLVLTALSVLLLTSCGGPTQASVVPPPVVTVSSVTSPSVAIVVTDIASVGEPVTERGVTLTVKEVTKVGQDNFQIAKAGKILVLVEVLIEYSGQGNFAANPVTFILTDGDGYQYGGRGASTKGLHAIQLASGDKTRGVLSFEVPLEAKGLVLVYRPTMAGASPNLKVRLE